MIRYSILALKHRGTVATTEQEQYLGPFTIKFLLHIVSQAHHIFPWPHIEMDWHILYDLDTENVKIISYLSGKFTLEIHLWARNKMEANILDETTEHKLWLQSISDLGELKTALEYLRHQYNIQNHNDHDRFVEYQTTKELTEEGYVFHIGKKYTHSPGLEYKTYVLPVGTKIWISTRNSHTGCYIPGQGWLRPTHAVLIQWVNNHEVIRTDNEEQRSLPDMWVSEDKSYGGYYLKTFDFTPVPALPEPEYAEGLYTLAHKTIGTPIRCTVDKNSNYLFSMSAGMIWTTTSKESAEQALNQSSDLPVENCKESNPSTANMFMFMFEVRRIKIHTYV